MKKRKENKMISVTSGILREKFGVNNTENHLIVFDNIKNIIFCNGKLHDDICYSPYKSNEAIMVFCTNGKVKAKIGVKNIEIKEQNLAVVMPGQIFEVVEVSPDFNATIIMMKDSFFDVRNKLSEVKELQQFILKEQNFHFTEEIWQESFVLLELIRKKMSSFDRFTQQILQHYCHILFYNFYALYKQKDVEEQIVNKAQKDVVFERFINEIERHFKTQHEVGFYAERLCITPKYLSLLIKEASGKTAADWIREYLVLEARALLKSGRMTVQQVSNELNFADQSHFGSFFKRYTGYSPSEYQRK